MKKYGKWSKFPKTGKRGRSKKSALLSDKELKYTQVVKNKSEGKLQNVEKIIIFGQNIDQSKISTSLLERQNLTFRKDNNRISGKTIRFSKKIKGLYNQMIFYCTYFNFCRSHRGLTEKRAERFKRKNTSSRSRNYEKEMDIKQIIELKKHLNIQVNLWKVVSRYKLIYV